MGLGRDLVRAAMIVAVGAGVGVAFNAPVVRKGPAVLTRGAEGGRCGGEEPALLEPGGPNPLLGEPQFSTEPPSGESDPL